jgi:hypothetical protein
MAVKSKEGFVAAFLNSKKVSPFLAALSSGVYPLFFYYSNNYTLIGSWEHMGIFFTLFIIAPLVIFWIASRIVKLVIFQKVEPVLLPFLNVFFFLSFLLMTEFSANRIIVMIVVFLNDFSRSGLYFRYYSRVLG